MIKLLRTFAIGAVFVTAFTALFLFFIATLLKLGPDVSFTLVIVALFGAAIFIVGMAVEEYLGL